MPYIWKEEPGSEGWLFAPLDGKPFRLSVDQLTEVADSQCDEAVAPPALLPYRGADGKEQWVLLGGGRFAISVNGVPLMVGMCVLCQRDEILVREEESGRACRWFFSSERLAQVQPFPLDDGNARCPRCKQPIACHDLAVKCPAPDCGAWHHQSDELPCWTYHTTCALCEQPTALDTGFRWTPEDL